MKKTAKYYKSHPEAAAKKRAYQKKYNRKPSQVKKRVELNKENRRRGTYGNGDGLDVSHKRGGGTTLERASSNRARNRGKK
jgi:hypothetical protein